MKNVFFISQLIKKNLIKKRLYDKALQINSEVNNYEKNVKEENNDTKIVKDKESVMIAQFLGSCKVFLKRKS